MKSENFEILRDRWPELASLGGFAEAYAHADPAGALMKLRLFAENLTRDIYQDLRLPKPDQPTFIDLLKNSAFSAVTPRVVLGKLHALRIHGNKAAHGEPVKTSNALWLLREAHDLARWLHVRYGSGDASSIPPYRQPKAEATSGGATQARERRQILEKLASQEAQMEALLRKLDESRNAASAAEARAEEIEGLAASANQAAIALEFDEATTRTRLIDSLLASVGWDVGADLKSTNEVGKEIEVEHQPTSSGLGYADYILWDDNGNPLAVIEAKKTSVDAERGRHQAKLYADGLEKMHGHRPVIFYTNGFDTWMWDDAQGFPPRKLYGFYSKDSLQYLVNFQRAERQPLETLQIKESIVNRLYQIEAIKRVGERFTNNHRKALVVQATGTGKTRVAIALTDLLIRAGWVKRVLFLCDRRELRKQAKNAYNDFLSEPIRIVTSRIESNASERIFLATYPAMQRVFQSFDVGFFDLIIADESHRSIYNVYGDIFQYFDCYQIGLTATPVNFVTRNTFRLFDCEDLAPTANYDLEQAVEDGYLTPFEVFEHTTHFLREGIRLEILTKDQIEALEEQGEDPSQFDFSSEQVDKSIYNRDTNRVILRNLMENGLRDATGQLPGKSIVFARNHQHAILMRQLFDEMYPQYGGKFCQVIDNYDPRAEQLIDDFKGDGTNDDLSIAISVDMLDTGIDVPEILNLVFAKPIKSPVKFWQMIGRGTRLCKDLFGPGRDKSIFPCVRSLEEFRALRDGLPARRAKAREALDANRVRSEVGACRDRIAEGRNTGVRHGNPACCVRYRSIARGIDRRPGEMEGEAVALSACSTERIRAGHGCPSAAGNRAAYAMAQYPGVWRRLRVRPAHRPHAGCRSAAVRRACRHEGGPDGPPGRAPDASESGAAESGGDTARQIRQILERDLRKGARRRQAAASRNHAPPRAGPRNADPSEDRGHHRGRDGSSAQAPFDEPRVGGHEGIQTDRRSRIEEAF